MFFFLPCGSCGPISFWEVVTRQPGPWRLPYGADYEQAPGEPIVVAPLDLNSSKETAHNEELCLACVVR